MNKKSMIYLVGCILLISGLIMLALIGAIVFASDDAQINESESNISLEFNESSINQPILNESEIFNKTCEICSENYKNETKIKEEIINESEIVNSPPEELINETSDEELTFSAFEEPQFTAMDAGSQVSLDWIYPTGNINVTQTGWFNVSVNVSCSGANCGEINVTLDPIYGNGMNYTMLNSSESGADAYSWEEIISSGGSAIQASGGNWWDGTTTNGDDQYGTINLPWNISFYGVNYSRIYPSSNGRVHYTTAYTTDYGSGSGIPNNNLKAISFFNGDMYIYGTTKVFNATAANPDRVIIEYSQLSKRGSQATNITAEVFFIEMEK